MRNKAVRKKVEWGCLIRKIRRMPAHYEIRIQKNAAVHPLKAGFRIDRYGIPKGERRNYRICLRNGKSIHIREYKDYYGIHWDRYDPNRSLIRHAIFDLPFIPVMFSLIGFGFLLKYIPRKNRLFRLLIR